MKTTIHSLFILLTGLWCSGILSACSDTPQGSVNIHPDQREITLSGTNPRTVNFEASGSWYVFIDYMGETEKWLNVTPLSGDTGENTVTITAKTQNYSEKDRTARVEIRLPANNTGIITVIQPAVSKPRFLISMQRTMNGAALAGPSNLEFQYDKESEKLRAFSTGSGQQAIKYGIEKSGGNATITVTPANGEPNTIPVKLIGERISSTPEMGWDFRDPYNGALLKQSTVRYEFSYDDSDDKLLQKITRSERITSQDGITLDYPILLEQTYQYKYRAIRIDSLIYISRYTDTAVEPLTTISDTVKYSLKYPENYDETEDNNLTAEVWNMLVFPDLQGEPLYSLTGYWMLGLTGNRQPNFPYEVTIESRIHSPEGVAKEPASRYSYSYNRADTELRNVVTDISYRTSNPVLTAAFTYGDIIEEEEPGEESVQ